MAGAENQNQIPTVDLSQIDMPEERPELDLSQIDIPISFEDRSFNKELYPELIVLLQKIRDESYEIVTPGTKMRIMPHGEDKWKIVVQDPKHRYDEHPEDHVIPLTPSGNWPISQTISKTPMEKKYHDTCIARGKRDLAIQNLNAWLQTKEMMMIRVVGDQYRALVSDRYLPYDNLDIVQKAARCVKTVNDSRPLTVKPVEFYKVDLTEQHMFMSIRDLGREYDIGRGDVYNPMVIISNSEVGDGALRVRFGFHRGRCLNMFIKVMDNEEEAETRKIHLGTKKMEGIYSTKTKTLEQQFWDSKVTDMLNAAVVDPRVYDEWAEEFKASKDVQVKDPEVAIKKIGKQAKLTNQEVSEILAVMMSDRTIDAEDRGTGYAVIQAMTQASHNMPLERQYEVAKIAGNVEKVMAVIA